MSSSKPSRWLRNLSTRLSDGARRFHKTATWTAVVDLDGRIEALDVLGVEDADVTMRLVEAALIEEESSLSEIRVLCLIPEYHAEDTVVYREKRIRPTPTGLAPGNERFMDPFEIVVGD